MAVLAVVLMILAPVLAQLIYFAVSRKREYLADASAASFTRYPEGLASALEKIARAPQRLAGATSATAPMYIINPLKRAGEMAANATSTHPPIDERVRILRAMGGAGLGDYDRSFREVTRGGGVIPRSALKAEPAGAAAAAARPAAPPPPAASTRENARKVDDFFYRQDGYRRIDCPCGATLRIPPDFATPLAKCPRCGTLHQAR